MNGGGGGGGLMFMSRAINPSTTLDLKFLFSHVNYLKQTKEMYKF